MQYRFLNWLLGAQARLRREEGQTLIEYGILIGLITVLVIASVTTIGTWVAARFAALASAL